MNESQMLNKGASTVGSCLLSFAQINCEWITSTHSSITLVLPVVVVGSTALISMPPWQYYMTVVLLISLG